MIVTRRELRDVAVALAGLPQRTVFVGGAILELIVPDGVGPTARPTRDVDVVVDIRTTRAYHLLAAELGRRGFAPDTGEGAPICRHVLDGRIQVDLMPTTVGVLGFSNRWHAAALASAREHDLGESIVIRIPTRPLFLATKIEALRERGADDLRASHDLEDVITVIDGSPAIVEEVAAAPEDVRTWLAAEARRLLADRSFVEAVPGHLRGDEASQERLPLVLERLRRIAAT